MKWRSGDGNDRRPDRDRGDPGPDIGTGVLPGGDTSTERSASPRVRQQESTVVAYKTAPIVWTGQHYRFQGYAGMHQNGLFGLENVAYCGEYSRRMMFASKPGDVQRHDAPDWDCTCGLHAYKERDRVTHHPILEVELYGRVIIHELGYRAQKQRILSVSIPRCDLCTNPVETMLVSYVYENPPEKVRRGTTTFRCAAHAKPRPDEAEVPVGDLRTLLGGVEVRL